VSIDRSVLTAIVEHCRMASINYHTKQFLVYEKNMTPSEENLRKSQALSFLVNLPLLDSCLRSLVKVVNKQNTIT
jgi:hypothetical protein